MNKCHNLILIVFNNFAAGAYKHIAFKDATIPYIVQKLIPSLQIHTDK